MHDAESSPSGERRTGVLASHCERARSNFSPSIAARSDPNRNVVSLRGEFFVRTRPVLANRPLLYARRPMLHVDKNLFAAAQAGDPAALERLLSQLRPNIQRYARFQCYASSSIEDVVQEA
jgi:hypothetical protein